ncbi:unnamed protein product [Ectocarpus sp. CCAP 1310/34]|nr:unnamed protein product [Ectocarpus sp. CCAP 1310/34]
MGVAVVVRPEVSMVCDAGSVSRPTGTSRDGSSWGGKIPPPKDGVREIALRPTTAAGSSGSRVVGLLILALASAIKLGNVESSMLVELPSGFRCIWNNLPHLVQIAAILLMVVLMYGVSRVFDRADDAMSARLSSATAAFLHERRQHYPPRVVYTATREKKSAASTAVRDAAFQHKRGHHAQRFGTSEGTTTLPPRVF